MLIRRMMLQQYDTEDKEMQNYKLIYDTGEIENDMSIIDVPLEKPLKKMYALWKIVGNDDTTTANMYCMVNNYIRWWTKGCSFQKKYYKRRNCGLRRNGRWTVCR